VNVQPNGVAVAANSRWKARNALGDVLGCSEVGRRERLAGQDREVDLDLVEPRGMRGEVRQYEVRPRSLKASIDGCPRWMVPLSAIQKTCCADA
jgi:hypothetical protein